MEKEVEILTLNENKVEIDKELVPLIKALNDIGLRTTQCCSGHGETDAVVGIALEDLRDIAIKQHGLYGNQLVLWWDPRKKLKPNLKEVVHEEVKIKVEEEP